MKDFIKMTLAVVCGIFIVSVISTFLCLAFFGAAIAAGTSHKTPLPKEGVLCIDMSKITLAEQSQEQNPFMMIRDEADQSDVIGLWSAVQAINAAAEDPSVKYIYLRPENMKSQSFAQVEELRTALSRFRSSGKPVVAGMEFPDVISYYLGSVSDKVYLSDYSGATYMMNGISSQLIFYKDLLDAFDVNIQLVRHGKYKSYGEMFTKNAPSEENLDQTQVMVSSLWNSMATSIAASRDITVEDFNATIDGLKLGEPQDFMDAGLVDALMTREQLRAKLAELAGNDRYEDVKFVSIADYIAAQPASPTKGKQKIAVIYADGDINMGDAKQQVAGKRFAKIIADVRADSTVKAVVLRVNSPGGAVFAADQIKTELDLLCEQKPVVASYGNYAASGGYWISSNCEKIYSDATTLTGSIGVFSVIPDFSKTLKNKLHVNVVSVNSNKHSDMLHLLRPMDKDEYALQQKYVDDIYDRFVSIVAEGRELEASYVDSIAQGRVWTGSDALNIGLVDEIGTLEDAIHWAVTAASCDAEQADVRNWNVVGYPKPLSAMDQILEMFGGSKASANPFAGTPFESAGKTVSEWIPDLNGHGTGSVIARIPFEIIN